MHWFCSLLASTLEAGGPRRLTSQPLFQLAVATCCSSGQPDARRSATGPAGCGTPGAGPQPTSDLSLSCRSETGDHVALFGLTSPRQHPSPSGHHASPCSLFQGFSNTVSSLGLHTSKAWRCAVCAIGVDPQPVDRARWVDAPATCPSGVQFWEALCTLLWRSRWNRAPVAQDSTLLGTSLYYLFSFLLSLSLLPFLLFSGQMTMCTQVFVLGSFWRNPN